MVFLLFVGQPVDELRLGHEYVRGRKQVSPASRGCSLGDTSENSSQIVAFSRG